MLMAKRQRKPAYYALLRNAKDTARRPVQRPRIRETSICQPLKSPLALPDTKTCFPNHLDTSALGNSGMDFEPSQKRASGIKTYICTSGACSLSSSSDNVFITSPSRFRTPPSLNSIQSEADAPFCENSRFATKRIGISLKDMKPRLVFPVEFPPVVVVTHHRGRQFPSYARLVLLASSLKWLILRKFDLTATSNFWLRLCVRCGRASGYANQVTLRYRRCPRGASETAIRNLKISLRLTGAEIILNDQNRRRARPGSRRLSFRYLWLS